MGGDIGNFLGNVTDSVGLTNYSGERALDAQRGAAGQANATMKEMYDQQRKDMMPYQGAGVTALSTLENNKFMDNWQQDPGYQNRLNEGMKAINGGAAARGLGNSGATMKALTKYGQEYASNEYQKVYDRNYGRLSQLAGYGMQAAGANSANAGAYGQGVAQNQIGMGNAAAANQTAQSNRMSGLVGQGLQAGAAFFSDLRLKTDIKPIPKADIDEMKLHLKAYSYQYKNKKYGDGEWIGVMAQDLEKSKLGKTLVVENEAGEKMIDVNRVLSLFLATMAEG